MQKGCKSMRYLALMSLALMFDKAAADGFRCGTRLVVTGDPVTRLTRACGQPDRTFRARINISRRGQQELAAVTQWVYARRGKRAVIVSILGGEVVHIERG